MPKYLFITYGQPGWRGVQIRAIRMAQYFPKDEVLFWNLYDDSPIAEAGFAVENKDPGLTPLSAIEFPQGIKAVIFADLPSNELFQFAVLQAACTNRLPVVICEQLYRKGQLQEKVFKYFVDQSDLFLVNALSSFTSEETEKIHVVPPQIEKTMDFNTRLDTRTRYGISEDALLLFGAGYHEKIFDKIHSFHEKLSKKNSNIYTIASSPSPTSDLRSPISHLIEIPFTTGNDYFDLLYASDIILVKFGYLQILESLALHKPTVVLGEAGHLLQQPNVIDPAIESVLNIKYTDEETYKYLESLVEDSSKREQKINDIKQLHDGSTFGAKIGAEKIKTLIEIRTPLPSKPRKLALFINDEIQTKASWIETQDNVYPVGFLMSMPVGPDVVKRFPEELQKLPITNYQSHQHEILPHSFKQLFVFSERKFDGLTDIGLWYEQWIDQLESLLKSADEVYVTETGKKLFAPLLKRYETKVKLL